MTDADARLVERAKAGERTAMEELLHHHRDRVWAICRRITGNDADANDACQEALISIVKHLHKFDGISAFSTWTYRIATNASLDELRRRGRRPTPMPLEHGSSRRHGVAAAADDRIVERMAVDDALALLPAEFRAAVALRDLCDLDYAQIAEVLGIPAGTVRSRIARGRSALLPLLEEGNQTRSRGRLSDAHE